MEIPPALVVWQFCISGAPAGFPAAEKTSSFADVAATTLYAPAVDWAVEAGVTQRYKRKYVLA